MSKSPDPTIDPHAQSGNVPLPPARPAIMAGEHAIAAGGRVAAVDQILQFRRQDEPNDKPEDGNFQVAQQIAERAEDQDNPDGHEPIIPGVYCRQDGGFYGLASWEAPWSTRADLRESPSDHRGLRSGDGDGGRELGNQIRRCVGYG